MRVVCTTPWVPAEWVRAHGLEYCGIWSCKAAPPPLSAGVCAFARFAADLALRDSSSAFIFSSHCDQLRRSFDAVHAEVPGRAFLFNLPATWKTPAAVQLFDSELDRLGRFLVRLGGAAPTAERLVEAALAQRLAGGAGSVRAESRASSPQPPRTPVAIVGGPMRDCDRPVLDLIEKLGATIVLNATEPGERNLWSAQPKELWPGGPERFSLEQLRLRLAEDYVLHCTDVYQRPNTRLYAWLRERLQARHARGIILWYYAWCDLWRAEIQTLRESFGLPVLPLEADIFSGSEPGAINRVEAFLESLR